MNPNSFIYILFLFFFRCIYNCDGQVSTKMNLVLSSEIDENYSQENSSVTYTWSIMKFESNKYVVFKGQGIWSEGKLKNALYNKSSHAVANSVDSLAQLEL